MIVAINYADEKYECTRKNNTKTAYQKGKVDKVIEYSPKDLDLKFREKNSIILSYPRGAGLWIWKPYIILKTLDSLKDGDYLFYADAGTFYINKLQHLIDALEESKQDMLPFELPLLERQFTKKETFALMNYSEYESNQICGTYILLKKTNFTISFIQEWLDYMEDERICSFKYFCPEIEEFKDFCIHREDQSVFSILCKKYKLEVFRDPSNYGERPWMYGRNNWDIVLKKYKNSPYPTTILSNRKMDPQKYKVKEFLMHYAWRMGIFNQKICYFLHGVKRKPIFK